jgi:hypothetical protein
MNFAEPFIPEIVTVTTKSESEILSAISERQADSGKFAVLLIRLASG